MEDLGRRSSRPIFLGAMNIEPVKLVGKYVSLEPLGPGHFDGLAAVGLEPSIWEFTLNRVNTREQMRSYLNDALKEWAAGTALPFVTRLVGGEKIVGSTRFGNIDITNRKAEIGWTWVAPEWQRSAVNTEAKLLMLAHAFEEWGCIRVEFKTDATNQRSRDAIARLGATEEGTLRNHMITETGRFRDSVYFSILDIEWPSVRERLASRLKKYE